jgi:UDP-N-acetylmuramoylalanine--D-glutamate ligase
VGAAVDLNRKRVLVVGVARTGLATALFCAKRGAKVTATDDLSGGALGPEAEQLSAAGCVVEFATHRAQTFTSQDLIVPSPGVPGDHAGLVAARAAGIPLWSEIELASRFLRGRMVGITGSNGKTTTTSLLGHILGASGTPVIVAGNIGTPLIASVDDSREDTVAVVEMSSFQLELIASMRPNIAVMLNLTPDHLDRHSSPEAYYRAKARIFENQAADDAAVLNADDPEVRRIAPARSQVYWFSSTKPVARGAYVRDNQIVFVRDTKETELLSLNDIALRGRHNVDNVLAAAAAAYLIGVAPASIAAAVRTFGGVEHRLEFVAEIAGVRFFNDSKATNVDATLKAIDAFPGGLYVILGGKDKGSDYRPLRAPLRERGKAALLIGAAAEKIATQLGGYVPLLRAETLDAAVTQAFELAASGDTILLAPACASFDQFENYEHRGRVFKQLVSNLQAVPQAANSRRKG